jgi:hypothetical protein
LAAAPATATAATATTASSSTTAAATADVYRVNVLFKLNHNLYIKNNDYD